MRVADRLKLFALAPGLGGAESLVTQPLPLIMDCPQRNVCGAAYPTHSERN